MQTERSAARGWKEALNKFDDHTKKAQKGFDSFRKANDTDYNFQFRVFVEFSGPHKKAPDERLISAVLIDQRDYWVEYLVTKLKKKKEESSKAGPRITLELCNRYLRCGNLPPVTELPVYTPASKTPSQGSTVPTKLAPLPKLPAPRTQAVAKPMKKESSFVVSFLKTIVGIPTRFFSWILSLFHFKKALPPK